MNRYVLPLCRLNLVIFLLLPGTAPSLWSQEKTKLSGWIRAGLEQFYEERESESFYAAKVQYELKLDKSLDVQIDLRGASTRHEIELREAYLTADLGAGLNLDFGQHKKRFGLEYQKSKENLRTIERTLIYRHLETFGFAGRELNFRYYRTVRADRRPSGYSFSLGYNEAHDINLIARWQRLRTLGSFALGLNGIVQRDKMDNGAQMVGGLGVDLIRDTDAHHVELEALAGQDPFQSEFERDFGSGKKIYFAGGKFLYSHRFNISAAKAKAFEPVAVASLLVKNLDRAEVNTVGLLAGANYWFSPYARLSANADFLLTNSPGNTEERTLAGSNYVLQMEVRW